MASVSVIVPVHNAAAFLRECLDSLIEQDVPCELILVDDGSTDGSADICRAYQTRGDVNAKFISTPCLGVSHARNVGIETASGEYIAFCDADDAYMPGALGRMLSLMESNNNCDIVVGRFSRRCNNAKSRGSVRVMTADDAIVATLYQRPGCHESAWAKLYRRELFDSSPNFIEGCRYEDLELCPRLYSRARMVAFSDEEVYFYRPNPASFITNWTPDRTDALFAVDCIKSFAEVYRPGSVIVPAAVSRRFSAYCNIAILALRHGEKKLARRCLKEIRAMSRQVFKDPRSRIKNRMAAFLARLIWR